MDRKVLLALGLLASLALTALLWALGVPGFFLLLMLPLLGFSFGRRQARAPTSCLSCGAAAQPSFTFCPAYGGRL